MELGDTLCKCLCSREAAEGLDRLEGAGFIPNEAEHQAYPQPSHPLLAYSTAHNQPLRGVPIREGELWFLCDDFECAKAWLDCCNSVIVSCVSPSRVVVALICSFKC